MNKIVSVLVIVAVMTVAAGAVSIMSPSTNTDSPEDVANEITYPITYVLDGGVNSDRNPTSYIFGKETELYGATKTNMIFSGWYLDAELTKSIDSITPDLSGALTLYAEWTMSLVGQGFTLEFEGSYISPYDYLISGESTYKYISADGDTYFINRITDQVITNPDTKRSQTTHYDDYYWDDENEDEYTVTQLENKTIDTIDGKKNCEVYMLVGEDYIQYEYVDGWIPYLIEYETTGFYILKTTYTLKETFTFESDSECEITAMCDEGITVTGSGTYATGSDITLTASVANGTTFSGWYDETGRLLSSSKTIALTKVLVDTKYYAKNNVDPDRTIDSGEEVVLNSNAPLTNTTWHIYDDTMNLIDTSYGSSLRYTFDDAGFYTIEYIGILDNGKEFNGFFTLLAKGLMTIEYDWTYDGKKYSYDLGIDYEDYLDYRNNTTSRSQGSVAHDLSFITYDDPYVVELAEYIKTATAGMTELEVANVILSFMDCITYELDEDFIEKSEYWKFPLETLFDLHGDCEDTAILYCAIAKAMDMDVAFILLPGHAIAGIAVDGCDGYDFTASDGTAYYYCETTSDTLKVGDNPDRWTYNEGVANVIPVI